MNNFIEILEFREFDRINTLLENNMNYIHQRFQTKKNLKQYWENIYGGDDGGTSAASIGIERIMNNIFSKYGDPVANPVGSDLFFELDDCFVNIDIKTFVLKNLNDARNNIPIEDNQNSYSGHIILNNGSIRPYSGNLSTHYEIPHLYINKICLTFFIVFLNNEHTDEIIGCFTTCMPNGKLYNLYGNSILAAGKNIGKARFNYSNLTFKTFYPTTYRSKLIYYDNHHIFSSFIN